MNAPTDRKYLKSHEWHLIAGDTCTIGITQFAADELTDVTYVDLPPVGRKLIAGKPFGVVESVKATSDMYSGVDGEVIAINGELNDHPEYVNESPFEKGWMIKVRLSNPGQITALLTAETYQAQLTG